MKISTCFIAFSKVVSIPFSVLAHAGISVLRPVTMLPVYLFRLFGNRSAAAVDKIRGQPYNWSRALYKPMSRSK